MLLYKKNDESCGDLLSHLAFHGLHRSGFGLGFRLRLCLLGSLSEFPLQAKDSAGFIFSASRLQGDIWFRTKGFQSLGSVVVVWALALYLGLRNCSRIGLPREHTTKYDKVILNVSPKNENPAWHGCLWLAISLLGQALGPCIYIYTHVHTYIHIYISRFTCILTHIYTHLYICLCIETRYMPTWTLGRCSMQLKSRIGRSVP